MGADYRVMQADFRKTLAACEGQAALIAMSPPYPDARTCYEGLEWEDYQALGDAVKDALLPGGHCLLNLSAPVRQIRQPALSDLLKKREAIHADLATGVKPPGELQDVLAEIEASILEAHGTERDPMPFRVFLDWYDRVGLTAPDTLAFGRSGLPGSFPARFRGDWEPLFWFRKPGPPFPIFPARVKLRATAPPSRGPIGKRRRDGTMEQQGSGPLKCPPTVYRGNLWAYGNVGATGEPVLDTQGHPARWPYRLAADIVACFSDVGDLVCDPFLGGGTTLCAACDGDRRFIGGDLAEEWARKSRELADRRYAQLQLTGAAR